MALKKKILQKVIDIDDDILYIASHHITSYFGIIIVTLISIAILFFVYYFLGLFFPLFVSYLIGFLGLLLYIKFVINILDVYLDAVLITNSSIIIYKWDGFFDNTIDILDFDALESVFSDQDGLLDVLFNQGNIYIRKASGTNIFRNVYNPHKVANKINKLIYSLKKETYKEEKQEDNEDEKIKLLAKAMLEVMEELK